MVKVEHLRAKALEGIREILEWVVSYRSGECSLIISDEDSDLSRVLHPVYSQLLPEAQKIIFNPADSEFILKTVNALPPKSLVVLIQSTSFRLNEFRFRLELFKRDLKVIEHPHLSRIAPIEYEVFLDAFRYDPTYYRTVGPFLKNKFDQAQKIELRGDQGSSLVYEGPFEDSKLNIGDYTGMKNIGGQFPIGEVFGEPKDLSQVNGVLEIFAFGDRSFLVNRPEKTFKIKIEKGLVVETENASAEFEAVLEEIRAFEKKVWVRELGFGLNRAFSRERMVRDIGTYERMCGAHLSLGMKHSMYTKEGFPKKQSRFHVDAFAVTSKILMDDTIIYENGAYQLPL